MRQEGRLRRQEKRPRRHEGPPRGARAVGYNRVLKEIAGVFRRSGGQVLTTQDGRLHEGGGIGVINPKRARHEL